MLNDIPDARQNAAAKDADFRRCSKSQEFRPASLTYPAGASNLNEGMRRGGAFRRWVGFLATPLRRTTERVGT